MSNIKLGSNSTSFKVGSSSVSKIYLGSTQVWASTHPEALDWQSRVISNGGTVSSSTLSAVSNFCSSMDTAGLRSKFLRLNLFCGNDLNACFTPLYLGPSFGGTQYGDPQDGNFGPFGSIDYTETGAGGGLSGNSSNSAYLDTGLNNTSFITTGNPFTTMGITYNNIHGAVYLSNLGTTESWMGGVIGGNIFGFEGNDYAGVSVFWGFGESQNWNSPAGSYVSNTTCSNEGLIVGNLKSGNDVFSVENTSCTDSSSNSNVAGVYTATNIYIMRGPYGYVLPGDPEPSYNSTDDTVAGYSLGLGFSSSELTSYYSALNSFQTALGRNIT